MQPFHFNTVPNIIFGNGKSQSVGHLIKDKGLKRPLVISDPGLRRAGLLSPFLESLDNAGLDVSIFDEISPDPTELMCLSAANIARQKNTDCVIGFGGGSSLDVAKIVSVLGLHDLALSDIYGIGNIHVHRLPMMLIPTTAGTGSEVTPISILTTSTNEKMGVVSSVILPDTAILDPQLTYGLPGPITAATGIDAMVHAIEAYASKGANNNPISQALSRKALKLMGKSLLVAVTDGQNTKARHDMLLGSMLAGQAFANSPVAAVHALAYPLGGHYKIPHGLSNALVLPHVLRFNIEKFPILYGEIAADIFPDLINMDPTSRGAALPDRLADLALRCGLQKNLQEMGISRNALSRLAKDAMNQTRLLVNNPREVTYDDALSIYEAAWQ